MTSRIYFLTFFYCILLMLEFSYTVLKKCIRPPPNVRFVPQLITKIFMFLYSTSMCKLYVVTVIFLMLKYCCCLLIFKFTVFKKGRKIVVHFFFLFRRKKENSASCLHFSKYLLLYSTEQFIQV